MNAIKVSIEIDKFWQIFSSLILWSIDQQQIDQCEQKSVYESRVCQLAVKCCDWFQAENVVMKVLRF